MTASVPLYPPLPRWQQVTSTASIRGQTFYDTASLHNWNAGRGAQLVPSYHPYITGGTQSITEGNSRNFRFRTHPRYTAIDIMWSVVCRCTSANRTAEFTIKSPYNTGTAVTYQAPGKRDKLFPSMYRLNLASQTDVQQEISINIEAVKRDIIVESITCWEVPRLNLGLSAAEGGVELTSEQYRQPIFADTAKSAGGLGDAITASADTARRVGMFSWAVPDTLTAPGARSFNSGVGESIFDAPIPIIGRRIYRAQNQCGLTAAVLARADASTTTADITFTVDSGDIETISFAPGAGYATFSWYTTSIVVNTEDLTELDGLPSSVWEQVDVSVTRTSVGGSIYIASVCIFEE